MAAPITANRSLGYIGFAREVTPGTGLAPNKFYKWLSHSLLPKQTIQYHRDGNVRDMTVALKEMFHHAGGFKSLFYMDEGGAMLAWAFGADSVAGGSAPYTHTITLSDSIPWICGEIGYYEGSAATILMTDRIVSSKVNQLVIEGDAGHEIFITPDFVGETSAFQDASPTSVTFADTAVNGPLMFQQSVFTLTSGFGADYATMAGQIQKFKLTITQNLEAVYGPNSLVPIGILEKGRDVHGDFTVVFSTADVYQQAYFGGNSGTTPSATIGVGGFEVKGTTSAGPPEYSADITCNLFQIEAAEPMLNPNAELAIMHITGRMIRSGATYPMSAVVKNAQATQYTA